MKISEYKHIEFSNDDLKLTEHYIEHLGITDLYRGRNIYASFSNNIDYAEGFLALRTMYDEMFKLSDKDDYLNDSKWEVFLAYVDSTSADRNAFLYSGFGSFSLPFVKITIKEQTHYYFIELPWLRSYEDDETIAYPIRGEVFKRFLQKECVTFEELFFSDHENLDDCGKFLIQNIDVIKITSDNTFNNSFAMILDCDNII